MARKIIVVDAGKGPGGDLSLSVVFWLTVPASLVRPNAQSASQVADATQSELDAIRAGTIREDGYSGQMPTTATPGQVGAHVVNEYNKRQAALDGSALARKWAGAYWDGAAWTLPA